MSNILTPESSPEFQYDAFISYRHVEPDRAWAKWLHARLETYRVPRVVRKKLGVSSRLKRVFRDEEELPVSADLNREVEAALRASRFLIVICSPRTPESRWVNREVERFRELGRHDQILALLIEGEPTVAFPPALREIRRTLADSVGSTQQTIEDVEPLAADVRASRTDETPRTLKRMAFLRVMACLLGIKFDDLRRREQERQNRRIVAGAVVLGFVAIGLALVAYTIAAAKEQVAIESEKRRQLLHDAANTDCVTARDLAKQGRQRDALAFLARTFEYDHEYRRGAEAALGILSAWRHSIPAAVVVGHERRINTLRFDRSGTRIVTASDDGTAKVWNVPHGSLRTSLIGHTDKVLGGGFSPDGAHVLTYSADRTARVWEAETGRLNLKIETEGGGIVSAEYVDEGKAVILVLDDGTAQICRGDRFSKRIVLQEDTTRINGAWMSPDGSKVATGSSGGTATIWNADDGESLRVLKGHRSRVTFVDFSRDGKRLVTASGDGIARLWDVDSGQLISQLPPHRRDLNMALFSPDGETVATGSWDDTAALVNLRTKRRFSISPTDGWIHLIRFSNDGRRLLTVTDTSAGIWSVNNGEQLALAAGHSERMTDAQFSPDGKWIATCSVDSTWRLWEVTTPETRAKLLRHTSPLTSMALSRDGRQIVVGTYAGEALLLDADDGKIRMKLTGHSGVVTAAAFSNDGRRVVTAGVDRHALIWDTATGEKLAELLGHEDIIHGVSFSPNGERVVTAAGTMRIASSGTLEQRPGDYTARIWNAHNGTLVTTLTGHGNIVSGAEFSHDGSRVLTSSYDHTARLWDVETGREITRLTGHVGYVLSAHFSRDGREIVTASDDHSVRIWNAADGRQDGVLLGHTNLVGSADFNEDGKQVVSTSWDRSIRVWDRRAGTPIAVLQGHATRISGAVFSPDGRRVFSVSYDGTIRCWDLLDTTAAPPAWFPDFLSLLGQRRLNNDGELEDLDPKSWSALRKRVQDSVARDDSRYAEIAASYLGEYESRQVRPGLPMTIAEQVTHLNQEGCMESDARRAYELMPWHSQSLFALARFEAPDIASHLRLVAEKRRKMEAWPWSRVATSLIDAFARQARPAWERLKQRTPVKHQN